MISGTGRVNDDPSWDRIAARWQERGEAPAADPVALRAHVLRETTRMRRWRMAELVLSAAAIVLPLWNVHRDPSQAALLVLVDTWAVLAIVWTFALLGRRGLWAPSAETSEAYLLLARERATLKVRTTWLALLLVAGQLLVTMVAQGRISGAQCLVALVWLAWVGWMRRHAVRERNRFDALLEGLRA